MTAAQDQQLLADFIALCRSGHQFYLTAAELMKDVELKIRLREMAALRSSISRQLLNRYSPPPAPQPQTVHNQSQQHYQQLLLEIHQHNDAYFFAELDLGEASLMQQLRQQIKTLHSPDLAMDIAFHLASMQIAHDHLRESVPTPPRRLH